jgi:proteic killer suppression protein
MIKSFKSRALEALYDGKTAKRVSPDHLVKLRRILTALDGAAEASDMDLHGFDLHPMRGNYKGFWSVWVSGNWRVIFRFEDNEPVNVDYLDYH